MADPYDKTPRSEHLQWAKERALELLDAGRPTQAFNSMLSDLRKHSALQDHPGLELGMDEMIGGHLNSMAAMRRWIEGFN